MAHYLTFLLCVVQISNTINNFIHLSFFQKKFTVESTLKQANPPAPRPTPPPWNLVRMGLGLAILIAETGNRVLLRRGVGIPSRYHLEECKGQNPPGKIPWRGGGAAGINMSRWTDPGFHFSVKLLSFWISLPFLQSPNLCFGTISFYLTSAKTILIRDLRGGAL